MSFWGQIGINTVNFVLAFILLRWFFMSIISHQLNKSAERKRKKNQTFKEWFFYSRFRSEIPKILLLLYFTILAIHPLGYLVSIISLFSNHFSNISPVIIRIIYYFDLLWWLLILVLFWSRKSGFNIERWIHKKGGNKKKK